MNDSEQNMKSHPVLGWICILLGLYPLAIAFGYLNTESSSTNAPMRIVGMAGMIFIIAGCMILLRQHGRLVDVLAALICFIFAIVGVWVSIFSPSQGISGGLPFVSEELNIILARGVFGFGVIVTSLMCIYAIRRALR